MKNQLTPWLVHTDENQLHALYYGKVNTMTMFLILVIKPEAKEAIIKSIEKQEVEEKVSHIYFHLFIFTVTFKSPTN